MRNVVEQFDGDKVSPRSAAVLALVMAVLVVLAGMALWTFEGWVNWVATPVFWLASMGLLGAIIGWYEARHPDDTGRQKAFNLAFLGTFFAVSASVIAWFALPADPGTGDRVVVGGILVVGWGMAVWSFGLIPRVRRSQAD